MLALPLLTLAVCTQQPHVVVGVDKLTVPAKVYWASSPTLTNETLVIAGAGLAGTRPTLCLDPACAWPAPHQPAAVSSWDHSVKFVLPPSCGPPCYARLAPGAAVVTINRPEVWWAASGWPLGEDSLVGAAITPSVSPGETLRVFGRSMAWSPDGASCADSKLPAGTRMTRLLLDGKFVSTANAATCYEAAFVMPTTAPTGRVQATVETLWGSSTFFVYIRPPAPAPSPVPPTFIDVQADCAGDLALALRKAAAAPSSAVVALGVHTYRLTVPLIVPSNTRLHGSGADRSTLSFELSPLTNSEGHLQAALEVGTAVCELQ